MAKKSKYKTVDYDSYYAAQEAQKRKAEAESLQKALNAIAASQNELKGKYNDSRAAAYQNARLSAIGNNEALAAKGLAGGLYDRAASGQSETARVNQNIALRGSIDSLNQSEQQEYGRLERQKADERAASAQSMADRLADMQRQKAEDVAAQNKNVAEYEYKLQKDAAEQKKATAEQKAKVREAAYEAAINEVKMFGKVKTKAAAKALGVKVGTKISWRKF